MERRRHRRYPFKGIIYFGNDASGTVIEIGHDSFKCLVDKEQEIGKDYIAAIKTPYDEYPYVSFWSVVVRVVKIGNSFEVSALLNRDKTDINSVIVYSKLVDLVVLYREGIIYEKF